MLENLGQGLVRSLNLAKCGDTLCRGGGIANHESHESEFRFQLIALMESTKIAAAT